MTARLMRLAAVFRFTTQLPFREGRQMLVPRYWTAQAIALQWRELPEEERVQAAEKFLVQEELDSGIVVGRGDHVRF